MNSRRIYLCGHMGSGKTTVGRRLSSDLGLPFYDTDSMVEKKEQRTIQEIFLSQGEDFFRDCEKEVLQSLKNKDQFICSLGGGAPVSGLDGFLIYLQNDLNTLWSRVKDDLKRPLVTSKKDFLNLFEKRKTYYEKAQLIFPCHEKDYSDLLELLTQD